MCKPGSYSSSSTPSLVTCAFVVLVVIEATTTAIEFISDYDSVFEILNELDEVVGEYNVAVGESQFADIEEGESLRYRTRPNPNWNRPPQNGNDSIGHRMRGGNHPKSCRATH